MKNDGNRHFWIFVVRTAIVLAMLAVLPMGYYLAAYFVAWQQDSRCFGTGRPELRTMNEVENCLFLYVRSECKAEDRIPAFASAYAFQQCVGYDILGIDPIHVLYDRQGKVMVKISAYE